MANNKVYIYMDDLGDCISISSDRLDRDVIRFGEARNGGIKLCFKLDESKADEGE